MLKFIPAFIICLFKNKEVDCFVSFLRPNCFTNSTTEDHESGVVSLCCMDILLNIIITFSGHNQVV